MFNQRLFLVVAAIWAVVMLIIWATLVPGWVSGWTLIWINAGAVALLVTLAMIAREGAPTRSIAHVLYDTEHQPKRAP